MLLPECELDLDQAQPPCAALLVTALAPRLRPLCMCLRLVPASLLNPAQALSSSLVNWSCSFPPISCAFARVHRYSNLTSLRSIEPISGSSSALPFGPRRYTLRFVGTVIRETFLGSET